MSDNPFWEGVEDTLTGSRVRVQTPRGEYTGYATYFEYDSHAVLLRDAETPDGETVDTVAVEDVLAVERSSENPRGEVVTVDPGAVAPQPYSVREFDTADFASFVRDVRRDGRLSSLPTVRPVDGNDVDDSAEWEVLSGHKRIEALTRAGVDRHPVEVEPLSKWEATVRFVDEHFPLTGTERDRCTHSFSEWYRPAEMHAAYRRLRERWDRERLLDLPAIAANEALLEAEDGPEAVHEVVTGDVEDSDDDSGDELGDVDDVASDLAAEHDVDESAVRSDLETLREHAVPLNAAKGALRRKYGG